MTFKNCSKSRVWCNTAIDSVLGCAMPSLTFKTLFPLYLLFVFKVGHLFLKWSIDPASAGLLLMQAYAVTNHKRLVLTVLGFLGVGAIILALVCAHAHFCNVWWTSVTGKCSFESLWPHQWTAPHYYNVSLTYVHVNYAQWSIRSKFVKVKLIITLLTVFFSQWCWFDPCHIVWHNCGGCDTRWHTGNMEGLQTISMEWDDTHTFTSWTKYVIILVAG